MRAPLSWLRDFAPFPDDVGVLRDALDDLGLVVEAIEHVGEGLGDVVVGRVLEIRPIKGADKIRLTIVDGGGAEPLEIVCGATNFEVGDRVPLAPVGAILPGGFEISQRKLRGVTSNGMLCSGKELGLSDDAAGLLILGDESPGEPGTPIMEALGLRVDTVFDITVEGNRPDAWCISGIARDLAGRLELPFTLPEPPAPAASGWPVEEAASASVDAADLCPRLTVSVLRDVTVGPSPGWIAQRLLLAGMRPINNVVDASNYVMLELGQPTHPYDLSLLPGRGLTVRRARPGETVETLDGVQRTTGERGRSLGDTGEDCLICDAEGTPVGIGGIMGGASSEIAATTTEVLLEAAYFTPMAIARTSKRLGLRTEASARFERGVDPWVIEPSVRRFCQLLAESVAGLEVADGMLDVRADVPEPFVVSVPIARVHSQIGVALGPGEIARLIEPIGFTVLEQAGGADDGVLAVEVPTNRPDIRPEPYGIDDVIEEIARTFGYSNVPRRVPTWPQPGRLTALQRSRREVKDVLAGLGRVGRLDRHVRVSNRARRRGPRRASRAGGQPPRCGEALPAPVPPARSSGGAGLQRQPAPARRATVRGGCRVLAPGSGPGAGRRTERRRWHRASRTAGRARTPLGGLRRRGGRRAFGGGRLARPGGRAPAAWGAPRPSGRRHAAAAGPAPHPFGASHGPGGQLGRGHDRCRGGDRPRRRGTIRPDPRAGGGTAARRSAGSRSTWVSSSTRSKVPRRITVGGAVSRFPSSDIDLAFVVEDRYPADVVADVLRKPAANCWSPCTCSTSTGAPASPTGARAWPTGCASAPTTGR